MGEMCNCIIELSKEWQHTIDVQQSIYIIRIIKVPVGFRHGVGGVMEMVQE